MVGPQSKALGGPQGGRVAHRGRSRGRADKPHLRAKTGHPGAAGLHRQGAAGASESVGLLSHVVAATTSRFCRVDSYGETIGHARAASSRINRYPGIRKTAWPEVDLDPHVPSGRTLLS